MDIFEHNRSEIGKKQAPLSERMRPRSLDEVVGQEHIIGEGRLLRRAISTGPRAQGRQPLPGLLLIRPKWPFSS